MKSPSIELPFPASRRRKYYVPTQELLRGDAGKGARRGEGCFSAPWQKRSKGQKVKRSKGQKVKRSKGQKVKRSKVTFGIILFFSGSLEER
ncbi:hypothetical protein DW830_03650 [Prevotella sp. AM34-19LB]|nr:hypothetical protein DW830_03650 [Prevotella sp. AM34-19LB]